LAEQFCDNVSDRTSHDFASDVSDTDAEEDDEVEFEPLPSDQLSPHVCLLIFFDLSFGSLKFK
jgi:hypothetical protein